MFDQFNHKALSLGGEICCDVEIDMFDFAVLSQSEH
jgi:hypothetical protein